MLSIALFLLLGSSKHIFETVKRDTIKMLDLKRYLKFTRSFNPTSHCVQCTDFLCADGDFRMEVWRCHMQLNLRSRLS